MSGLRENIIATNARIKSFVHYWQNKYRMHLEIFDFIVS